MRLLAQVAWWLGRRPTEPDGAFPYVHIEEDGAARELTAGERAYLTTEFPPGDGGRPYVKSRYRERTPDGRLAGFLPRVFLPTDVVVTSSPRSEP